MYLARKIRIQFEIARYFVNSNFRKILVANNFLNIDYLFSMIFFQFIKLEYIPWYVKKKINDQILSKVITTNIFFSKLLKLTKWLF